jgi:exopolysaccharide production protein ExoQ
VSDESRALSLNAPPRSAAVQSLARPLERLWAILLLSIVSGAYLPLAGRLLDLGYDDDSLAPLTHRILFPLYALAIPLVFTNPNALARAAWRGRLALALVALACLSSLWSVEPQLSLLRGISLLAPTGVALILAVRFTHAELLRLLAVALGVAGVLSAVVAVVMPEEGILSIEYGTAWRGVFENKNSFARIMALTALVFFLLALDSKYHRKLAWLATGGAVAMVLLAQGATSLVAMVAIVVLIPVFRSLRLRPTAAIGVLTVSILTAAVLATAIMANTDPVFALLGRDATLTGRTDIWAAVLLSITERPLLGYGYSAFWHGWDGPSLAVVGSVGWETPHSHNGFLDLCLDLGLVGLLVFLCGLGSAARSAVGIARTTDSATGLWPLSFLSFLMILNVAEAAILRQHSLFWILYVAVLSSEAARVRGSGSQQPASPPVRARAAPPRVGTRIGPVSPGVRRTVPPRGQRD